MNLGSILIYISLVLALLACIFSITELIFKRRVATRHSKKLSFYSKLASIFLFITVTGALLLLYIYFITSNMDIQYVWEHSSTSLSIEYKISGVLAGMSGSLLFWVWCMTLSWFVEEIKDLRNPKSRALIGWTRSAVMIVTAIFLYFLVLRDIFKETPSSYLAALPDGRSLNPLLQTPLMIVHPPVVFLAYGFVVICMASAIAFLICGDKDWVKLSTPWGRLAWLFLTLGIGIGGLWAYVVLGWGGYWGWDPVETSSLLPWLLLTAFLHAQLMFKRKGHYKFAAPALGIYSFVLVVFATFATRAGGIWISVHAFGEVESSKTAFDRFFEATTGDNVILGYFLLMIGISVIGLILLAWRLHKEDKIEEEDSEDPGKNPLGDLITDNNLMFITLILISVTTLVTLLQLIMSINGVDVNQFNLKVGVFAMIGIIVLVMCMVWKYLGGKVTMYSLLFAGAVSLILFIVIPNEGIYLATFPFLLLAVGATSFKIIKSINRKSLRASMNGIAPHLVHLGVVFVIIGFIGSNFFVTEKDMTLQLNGDSEKVGDYDLRLTQVESAEDSIYADVEISQNGDVLGHGKPGLLIIDYQGGEQLRSEIDVISTYKEDIYLTYNYTAVEGNAITGVNLQVKILPLMNVLWTGMWLMALGISMRAIVGFIRPKKKDKVKAEGEEEIDSDKEALTQDYEAMIEKELEEME